MTRNKLLFPHRDATVVFSGPTVASQRVPGQPARVGEKFVWHVQISTFTDFDRLRLAIEERVRAESFRHYLPDLDKLEVDCQLRKQPHSRSGIIIDVGKICEGFQSTPT